MSDPPTPAGQTDPQNAASEGLRGLFPGYFPPGDEELKDFLTAGTVVLDANALFDAYRLNPGGRDEFLGVLRLLGNRLWVPHQVAYEFLENRTSVINECLDEVRALTQALREALEPVQEAINKFASRRRLSAAQHDALQGVLGSARVDFDARVAACYELDVQVEARPDDDPVFTALNDIISDKIGAPLDDQNTAEQEAQRRITEKIPPGYCDAKKDGNAAGDYLLWAQTLREAKHRQRPVLLVTNDQKEDWARIKAGRRLGPRPELVIEMLQEAGQAFHLVTVQGLLVHARTFLNAHVSDTTVDQAAHVAERETVVAQMIIPAARTSDLSPTEQAILNLSPSVPQALHPVSGLSPMVVAARETLAESTPLLDLQERITSDVRGSGAMTAATNTMLRHLSKDPAFRTALSAAVATAAAKLTNDGLLGYQGSGEDP